MTFKPGNIEITNINGNKIQKITIKTKASKQVIINNTTIDIPIEAHVPGKPLAAKPASKTILSFKGNASDSNIKISQPINSGGLKIQQIENFPPGYNTLIISNQGGPKSSGKIIQTNKPDALMATKDFVKTQAYQNFKDNYVKEKAELFNKLKPDNDGKFTFGEFFGNIGKGIVEEAKGIVKSIATPVGFLTTAAIIGTSILFPPAGIAIAGTFLALGAAKTGYSMYKAADEYAKGNYDNAERAGKGIGAGMLDTGLAYLGLKGAIKNYKNNGFGIFNKKPKSVPPPPNPDGPKALPPPETKALQVYEPKNTGNNLPVTSNNPPPSGSTGGGAHASGTYQTTKVSSGYAKANPSSTSGFSYKNVQARIDGAEKVSFVEPFAGRRVSQNVKNPYKVLGIDPNKFSDATLKSNYRALAQKFHPDRHPELGKYMQEIVDAHTILKNPAKRAAINEALKIKN